MTKDRHLHVVSPEEMQERKTLLTHPAFDGVFGHEQMSTADIKAYIETWKAHTYRGQQWIREHQTDPSDRPD